MYKILKTPLDQSKTTLLTSGDQVLISGKIYTARDAAHKRFAECILSGKKLPLDLKNQILYYTGPTPERPDGIPQSAGPTTSSRMDPFTPRLIEVTGLSGIIGKGNRSSEVIASFIKNKCVYFAATGGAGALLGNCIVSSKCICYEDLGPEAVYQLTVEKFPVTVAIDTNGKNRYVDGPFTWKKDVAG